MCVIIYVYGTKNVLIGSQWGLYENCNGEHNKCYGIDELGTYCSPRHTKQKKVCSHVLIISDNCSLQ